MKDYTDYAGDNDHFIDWCDDNDLDSTSSASWDEYVRVMEGDTDNWDGREM